MSARHEVILHQTLQDSLFGVFLDLHMSVGDDGVVPCSKGFTSPSPTKESPEGSDDETT